MEYDFKIDDVVHMDHDKNKIPLKIKTIIPPHQPGFETSYWWANFHDSPMTLRLDWLKHYEQQKTDTPTIP